MSHFCFLLFNSINETYLEEYNIRDLFIEILCEIALNS